MAKRISEAMKLANRLAKQGPMNPEKATKKQRALVHQWAKAIKEILEIK